MKKHSIALLVLTLGLTCLVVHFVVGWHAFQQEAHEYNSAAVWSEYLTQWTRDVFENLQTEFIQLFFQFLLMAGAFGFLGVNVHEEDQEEDKHQLARIEARLSEQQEQ